MSGGLLAFILTCIVIELTPGPNMAYLALLSADRGRAAGAWAVLGVALGLVALGLLAVAGFGTIVSTHPLLFEMLRWGGVAYLFYLAYDAWAASRSPAAQGETGGGPGRYFARGLVNNLLNPKAALFYVTVLPGFADPSRSLAIETARLGAIYVAVATLIHAGVVGLAGTAERWLDDPMRRQAAGLGFAGLLSMVAIWVLLAIVRQ
jgi:threonine/homoserine/homoserine lactone efflux protein